MQGQRHGLARAAHTHTRRTGGGDRVPVCTWHRGTQEFRSFWLVVAWVVACGTRDTGGGQGGYAPNSEREWE